MFLSVLLKFLWDIQIPISQEAKYSIFLVSVIIFLVAFCVLLWQICRYCKQPPLCMNPVYSSLLYTQSAMNRTQQNSQLQSLYDEVEPLSHWPSSNLNLSSSTDSLLEAHEEQIHGSLHFSLFYDKQQSRLFVTVLEAYGLATQKFGRSMNLYIHVRVLLKEMKKEEPQLTGVLQEWKTCLSKNSRNPIFGDQFSCRLSEEEVSRATVQLLVKDFDKYSRRGVLGEVRAFLGGLNISNPLEMLEGLKRPKQDIVGEVLLSLKYMPTCHRLEVGVLKIRTIVHSTNTESALYVRTKVLCNQCRIRHQRTTEKTRWPITVFNEVMVFKLPEAQIRECVIILCVYELCPQKKFTRCLIGHLRFGKSTNEEDEHWRLMMRMHRQPVAQWHLLCL